MFSFLFDPINISLVITALINLSLGVLIFISGKNKRINIVYSLNIVAIISWVMAMFFYRSSSPETNLFWCTVLYVAPTLVASSFLYFTYIFPYQKEKYIWWRAILIFAINFGIIVMVILPGLIIKEVNVRPGMEKQIIFTSYYWFYFLYTLSVFSFGFFRLFVKYSENKGIERLQIIYLVVGYALAANLAFITNLIMPWIGFFFLNWLGQVSTCVMVAFTTYAILKYRLMNIKLLLTEFLVAIIAFVLLAETFISTSASQIFYKGALFIVFCFLGYLLIKSVLKEIKQREEIEKMAEDIERAYVIEKKAKETEKIANEKLLELDKAKNQFLMQTQHDLRRPLTVITWYSDLLIEGDCGKISKKAAEIVKKMQGVAREKIKDVNNFLDIEQFKMGKGVVTLKPGVELLPIFEEIVNVLSPGAQSKGIYLKFEKPEKALIVNADREKLKAAIFDIIDNAIKYTPKGGVNVKVESDKDIKITISDTGIGIAEGEIKNIFESQFKRAEKAQKVASGSGIGLYLSAQIIKLHNGKVWAESQGEGKGSTFYIELPA